MIIGIDLGTTNSLVAYFTEDGAKIIPNRLGENLTPSAISIDEDGHVYVGKIAKERMITHPESSANLFKRSMGSKKTYMLSGKEYKPEDLSSMIIASLKEDAEKFLGEEITEAVVSVPAYFNDYQRKATKIAGQLAGLNIERIVSEPTAAAIAYGLNLKKLNTKFIVFDLGGGTFDVSILELYRNIMEVRAVGGDNFLGGEDFTEIICSLFLREKNLDINDLDIKTIAHLKKQAELCKMGFTNSNISKMTCKINDEIIEYELTLDEYERGCQLLLEKLRRPIEGALRDAKIKIREIDEIILVGGGTKLKIVRNFVAKLFGRLPSISINPDEVVALGASIQGAMKERNEFIKETILTDVCPYTLGTDVVRDSFNGRKEGGHFCPIIERNTVIPASRTERLVTAHNNQTSIKVEILQGESRFSRNNIYLGEIEVPVPKGKAGDEGIDVTYTYDINSMLEVQVKVISTGFQKKLVIKKNDCVMTEEEVEERFKELQELKIPPRDKEENKLLLARGERLYEESLGDIRREIAEKINIFEGILEKQDRLEIEMAAKELRKFFEDIEEL
ncbi:Hsp70 family protein [Clostridium sp. LP20]|uniref:Hsp70 family protein n=1 Tax=Clostridium sp. LP20 TaxID=3418665 RepID=UPI003EE66201